MIKVLVVLIMFLCLVSTASATDYYVATDGNDSDPGSLSEPWLTMTYAESQLSDGDTVYVRGGIYTDTSVTINVDNVTFENYEDEVPILDGAGIRPGGIWDTLLMIEGNGSTIDGLTVRRSTGYGTQIYADDVTIRNHTSYQDYRMSLTVRYADNALIEDSNISLGAMCMVGGYTGLQDVCGEVGMRPPMVSTKYSTNPTFRRTKIYDSYNEGIDIDVGTENATIEYCEIYGQPSNIYLVNSINNIVRYNLIYGTGDSDTCIKSNNELQWEEPDLDTNNTIYGNLVAGCTINYWIGGAIDRKVHNSTAYNNVFIEAYTGVTPTAVQVQPGTGSGHIFKNNIIWQTDDRIAYVPTGLMTCDYNLWSRIPDTDAQGSNDPIYAIPEIAKSTGWTSLTGGELDGSEFTLNSTSYAIDNGTDLGSPYDQGLANTSTWVDSISLLNQSLYGSAWEIGAFVYGTAAESSAPNITSWENNKTSNNTLDITINTSEEVNFNATANQTITTWNWYKDDADQSHNYDNITLNWSAPGLKHVVVNATNTNGTSDSITWNVTVEFDINMSYFTYHKIITINQSMVNQSTGTGTYPMLVSTTDTDLRDNAQADGDDIVFFASDNTTLLPYEQEFWNSTNGELVEHIGVDDITNVTYIVMYYGNATIANSENATGVWDDNFVLVQHLSEIPTATIYDSTSNNNDGTTVGMDSADQVAGQIDGCLDFDGADRVELTSLAVGNNAAFTISTWVNGTAGDIIYGEGYSGDEAWATFLGLESASPYSARFYVKENNVWKALTAGTTKVNDSWHYITIAQASKSSRTIYIDGDPEETDTDVVGDMSTLDTANIGVLERATFGSYWVGKGDEVRVSDIARSHAWTETEYNNTAFPSLFISIGAEQSEGTPDTIFEFRDGGTWKEDPEDYHFWFDCYWNTSGYPDGVCQNAGQSVTQHSLRVTNNGSGAGTTMVKFNESSPAAVTVYIDDDYTVAGATVITDSYQEIGPVLQPGENATFSAWVDLDDLTSVWEFVAYVEVQ